MTTLRAPPLLLVAGLAASACSPRAPTYHDDVAPLLARSCLSCHEAPGRIPLARYADVAAHASLARWAIESGAMPPGNVDRGGGCGTFSGPRPPDGSEVALLRRWIDAGLPEGAPRPRPTATRPERPPGEAVRVAVAEGYLPEPGDDHRCFLVDAGLASPRFLTGFEVHAGVPEEVHHVLLFSLRADADTLHARTLDGEDARPGWSCDGAPRVSGAELVGVFTPGVGLIAFPPDSGLSLAPRPLVVQVHYRAPAQPRPGRIELALFLAGAVPHPLALVPFAANGFVLPPGEAAVSHRRLGTLPIAGDALLFGVMPHLHTLGRSIELRSVAAGEGEAGCLVRAPRWNYGWQEIAFYESPRRLSAGELLELTCTWSTSGRTREVVFGEETDDEMCMVFLLIGAGQ